MAEQLIKIDDTAWRLEDDFVRCFLLIGREKALWIDSGVSGQELKRIAAEYTSLPVLLLNTHGDGDHVSANAQFEEFYMAEADYDYTGLREKAPGSRCIFLRDGDVIDLGGLELEMISIPGHTAGSVAVLDRTNRRLYSGDSVQTGKVFLFGEHRRPELFADALQKLIGREADYDEIAPSHDTPILPADAARKVLADWNAVLEGKITAQEVDLFGTKVKDYAGEFCGFFMK